MRIWKSILILLFLSSCGASHDKMGEAMLINSGKLKVKVVQIYDDMPLHYYGLTHQIWCQSPETMDMAWGGMERGWNRISYSGISKPGQSPSKEIQKKALDAAAMDANKYLRVINDEAIAYASGGIFVVTINGCKNFSTWNGWDLPKDMVFQAGKPSHCKVDECAWENFKGDNEIMFSDLQIDVKSKKISFIAHSKAFKDGDLLVRSKDGGMHWKVSQ